MCVDPLQSSLVPTVHRWHFYVAADSKHAFSSPSVSSAIKASLHEDLCSCYTDTMIYMDNQPNDRDIE